MRKNGGGAAPLRSVLIWTLTGCLISALLLFAASALVASGGADEELLEVVPTAAAFLGALVASLGAPGRHRDMAFPAAAASCVTMLLIKLAADIYDGGSLFDRGDIPVICAIGAGALLGACIRGRRKK